MVTSTALADITTDAGTVADKARRWRHRYHIRGATP